MYRTILNKKIQKTKLECQHRLPFDFGSILAPFLHPKSVLNQFQSGVERALNEDSALKLKKERSKSGASLKLEDFGASGGRETGRGHTVVLTRLTTLSQGQGVGGYRERDIAREVYSDIYIYIYRDGYR